MFDQVTLNAYDPGDGISAHVDLPHRYDDGIATISLGAPVVFELERCQNGGAGREAARLGKQLRLQLRAGDLLLLHGDARWNWMHGIAYTDRDEWGGSTVVRGRRISLSLRKLLPGGGSEPPPKRTRTSRSISGERPSGPPTET